MSEIPHIRLTSDDAELTFSLQFPHTSDPQREIRQESSYAQPQYPSLTVPIAHGACHEGSGGYQGSPALVRLWSLL